MDGLFLLLTWWSVADAPRVLVQEMGFSTMTDAQPRDLLETAALLLMRLQDAPPPGLLPAGTGPHPIPSVLGW